MPDLIRVDVSARQARQGDKLLELTRLPFLLLAYLVANAGCPVTREQISQGVWNAPWCSLSKTIDVHVSNLRKTLGDDPANPVYISTVHGIGYRFEPGMGVVLAGVADLEAREVAHA